MVEAETRVYDIQALLRRLALKREAGGVGRVVLLVAGTHHNREAVRVGREPLASEFPGTTRSTLSRLAQGIDPGRTASSSSDPPSSRAEWLSATA